MNTANENDVIRSHLLRERSRAHAHPVHHHILLLFWVFHKFSRTVSLAHFNRQPSTRVSQLQQTTPTTHTNTRPMTLFKPFYNTLYYVFSRCTRRLSLSVSFPLSVSLSIRLKHMCSDLCFIAAVTLCICNGLVLAII